MYKIGYVTSHDFPLKYRTRPSEKMKLSHLRRGLIREAAERQHIVIYHAPDGTIKVLKNIFDTPGLSVGDCYPDPLPLYKWLSTEAANAHPNNDIITLPGGFDVRRDSDEYRTHVKARDEAVPVDYERGTHKLFKEAR